MMELLNLVHTGVPSFQISFPAIPDNFDCCVVAVLHLWLSSMMTVGTTFALKSTALSKPSPVLDKYF